MKEKSFRFKREIQILRAGLDFDMRRNLNAARLRDSTFPKAKRLSAAET